MSNKISGLDEKVFDKFCSGLFPSGCITKKDFLTSPLKETDSTMEKASPEKASLEKASLEKASLSMDTLEEATPTSYANKQIKKHKKDEKRKQFKTAQKNKLLVALEKVKIQTRLEKNFTPNELTRLDQIIYNKNK